MEMFEMTLEQLESLACTRKHTDPFDKPLLDACFNRRDEIIAMICPLCHKFYVVVDGVPLKYPKELLPGYQRPALLTTQERGDAIRKRNEYRQGLIIGKSLRRRPECWHDTCEIGVIGELSYPHAKELLLRLVKHGFVVEAFQKHNGSRCRKRVWMLVPTWRETTPCDHDALCKGFWSGVKPFAPKAQEAGSRALGTTEGQTPAQGQG